MKTIPMLLLCLIMLSSCAGPISKKSMDLVDQSLNFPALRNHPDLYRGKYILLGGVIAGINNSKAGGEMEIVQAPLDRGDEPEDSASSQGRFLARSDNFLDPLVYRPGMKVTLVGEVQGIEVRNLFQTEYAYPVVAIRELHLWKPEERRAYPAFTFGVGIGAIF